MKMTAFPPVVDAAVAFVVAVQAVAVPSTAAVEPEWDQEIRAPKVSVSGLVQLA